MTQKEENFEKKPWDASDSQWYITNENKTKYTRIYARHLNKSYSIDDVWVKSVDGLFRRFGDNDEKKKAYKGEVLKESLSADLKI